MGKRAMEVIWAAEYVLALRISSDKATVVVILIKPRIKWARGLA
jgi:hypothetical protein